MNSGGTPCTGGARYLNTVQHEKTYYRRFCEAIRTRKNIPDSLLDWEETKWVQFLKGWMLKNGIALNAEKKSVYGTAHMVEAELIRYLRRLLRFLQPEDTRMEQEKDIWTLENLDGWEEEYEQIR